MTMDWLRTLRTFGVKYKNSSIFLSHREFCENTLKVRKVRSHTRPSGQITMTTSELGDEE